MSNDDTPKYQAPGYLPGGHAQTIFGSYCFWPRLRYERERFWFEDPDALGEDRRDFIDVDWAGDRNAARLLVLFHGLEGNSGGLYARKLGTHFIRQGWRFAVPHFRGCSEKLGLRERNVQLRSYHAGDTDQIDLMLAHCKGQHGNRPVYAAGVSLGGNALLRWLARRGEDARALVLRAAAISVPFDLHVTGEVLARGFHRIYARSFLGSLRESALAKLGRYRGAYDGRSVRKVSTLRAFDDLVTAPVHDFRDVDDYYARSSSGHFLQDIRVPTLLLSARNDPFTPDHVLRGIEALEKARRLSEVTLNFQEEGGHVAFPGDRGWLQHRVFEFLAA